MCGGELGGVNQGERIEGGEGGGARDTKHRRLGDQVIAEGRWGRVGESEMRSIDGWVIKG